MKASNLHPKSCPTLLHVPEIKRINIKESNTHLIVNLFYHETISILFFFFFKCSGRNRQFNIACPDFEVAASEVEKKKKDVTEIPQFC